jgi:TonB family protein
LNQEMSGKSNISGLFDVSGNLTIQAMESFLSGSLSQDEREQVQKHLDENPFDREAMEGLQKHYSAQNLQEIEELRKSVIIAAGKLPETGKRISVPRTYWYAAAGLVLLLGFSVFMVLMFRTPLNKPELAVLQPDTIVRTATAVVQEDQKQSVAENDIIPVTPQVTRINIVEDDAPVEEKELAAEPEVIINDDVIVDADLLSDEKIVGGIETKDEAVQEEYIIASEMAAPESSGRAMSKMAVDSEEEMAEESQIFMVVEQMPEFPGGEEALYKFLAENITYPQAAKESGIQGRVFVTFVVERDGSVIDIRVLRGIGGGCDEEAIRIVKAMPKWIPGKQRGKPVRVQYNLPVKFSLQ